MRRFMFWRWWFAISQFTHVTTGSCPPWSRIDDSVPTLIAGIWPQNAVVRFLPERVLDEPLAAAPWGNIFAPKRIAVPQPFTVVFAAVALGAMRLAAAINGAYTVGSHLEPPTFGLG
jgi:hypothetical protein